MYVARLDRQHSRLVERFLLSEVDSNLFLLGVLEAHQLATTADPWFGALRGRGAELEAVAFVAGNGAGTHQRVVVPFGSPEGCEQLGALVRDSGGCRMVVGPREASDALWAGLGKPTARIAYDQRLYVCRAVDAGPELPVRPARVEETDALADMAGDMMREDIGEDPRVVDAAGHRARTLSRIEAGRTWVYADDSGDIQFKLDVGTSCARGVQVGGTWVPLAARGKGVATRGMRSVTRRLLSTVPLVTLHVHEQNLVAVRCYERVGYRASTAFRLFAFLA